MNPYRRGRHQVALPHLPVGPFPASSIQLLQRPFPPPFTYPHFSVSEDSRMSGFQRFAVFTPRAYFPALSLDQLWALLHPMLTDVLRNRMYMPSFQRMGMTYGVKFTMTTCLLMAKPGESEDQSRRVYHTATPANITSPSLLSSCVQRQITELNEFYAGSTQVFARSNVQYKGVDHVELQYAFYGLQRSRSYIPTPVKLARKKCVVNPENEDSLCFQWCLYAYHHANPERDFIWKIPEEEGKEREERDRRVESHGWNWNGVNRAQGATLEEVIQFETYNPSYCFCIIYWDPEEKNAKNASKTIYISPHWNSEIPRPHQICLMMLSEGVEEPRYHFTWVHNYHKLFSSFHAGFKKFVCLVDGILFHTEEEFHEHSLVCQKPEQGVYTMLSFPKPQEAHCEFKEWWKQLETPYYIVADMESVNVKIVAKAKCTQETCRHTHYYTAETLPSHQSAENTFTCQYCGELLTDVVWDESMRGDGDERATKFLSEQRSNSQAFYVVCTFDSSRNKTIYLNHANNDEELFREDAYHAGTRFMKKLLWESKQCIDDVERRVHATTVTEEEEEDWRENWNAERCCICRKPLERSNMRAYKNVLTQKIEGGAHSVCITSMKYGFQQKAEGEEKTYFSRSPRWSMPVFFHNLKNYDGHFIIQWLHDLGHGGDQVRVIAQNTEKFVSISLPFVKFLDSFAFMTSGLSTLVDVLRGSNAAADQEEQDIRGWMQEHKEQLSIEEHAEWQNRVTALERQRRDRNREGTEKFKFLRQEFDRDLGRKVEVKHREEALSLCFSKGHLPYEYIDSISRLTDPCLPPRTAYSSRLMGTAGLTEEEYKLEQRKWELFKMTTLRDAHDLYLKLDILLLADVLENFRQTMFREYGLDPTWNYTLPGYAWDSLLRMGYQDEQNVTQPIRLQLFDDTPSQTAMMLWLEKDIRGGMCNAPRHYAFAQHPYVPTLDPGSTLPQSQYVTEAPVEEKENIYLMYVDANQLYSWAMTQKLPYDQFQWIDASEMNHKTMERWTSFILNISDDADYGAILEVDLEYPQELHESHTDYPLAPVNRMVHAAELSPLTHHIISKNKLSYTPSTKLCGTLEPKSHYKVYYRNLKLYLQQGMKLTAVYQVMRFRQVAWMKTFIMHNVQKRAVCQNDFEKDLYKLQNNAVFGKTMENVRKRCRYDLHMEQQPRDLARFQKRVQSPYYKQSLMIAHNTSMLGVSSHVSRLTFNKPITTGFVVLDLSKELMFRFHYNVVKAAYGDRVKLCMTDTDSLVERIRTPNLYADLKQPDHPMAQWMDFSNYKSFNRPGCNRIPLPHVKQFTPFYEAHGYLKETWRVQGNNVFFFQKGPTIRLSDEFIIPPNVLLEGAQPQNNKVQGKFKDENAGHPLVEICALKPKCYAMEDLLEHATLKAKGIPKKALRKEFGLEQYKNCIRQTEFSSFMIRFHKLLSQKHAIYMIEREMIGLTGLNSKSYTCDNGIETLAFGDKRLAEQKEQSIWK